MAAPKSFFLSPEAHEYLVAHGTPPDAVQRKLIDETLEIVGLSGLRDRYPAQLSGG